MESTALVLLALVSNLSGMGVMFGWQPMPDDGDKVEYIVQIEPELAATLQEGPSIPITSDIPDDIGPIGRIRIVVGRDELPRQNLVTRFKPWPEQSGTQKESREGLVEAQFTAPATQPNASGRYADTAVNNGSILPPGGSSQPASNPFAQSLQQGAEAARNSASNVDNEILPPSSDQLFGSGGAASRGVQDAINNTRNQFGQSMQRGVEQVADRTEQQIRQAADNFGQRASNAVDEFGRALTSEQSIVNNRQNANNSTILPPGADNTSQPDQSQPFNRQLQPQRQPIQGEVKADGYAGSSRAGTKQPGDFQDPWPASPNDRNSTTAGNNQPTTRYGNQGSAEDSSWNDKQIYPPQNQQSRRDGFDLANRRTDNSQQFDSRQFNNASSFAGDNNLDGPELAPSQRSPLKTSADIATQQRSGPAVTRDMLANTAANNESDDNNQDYQQRQVTARQQLETDPRNLGWSQNDTRQDNTDPNSKTLFPLLLSWVLLSGSGAGNLYLFWSYLDVRSKYHGMVHGSPIRRDRYDD